MKTPSALAVAHIRWLTSEFQIFPSATRENFLIELGFDYSVSAPRHHLKKKTPEIFGFRNCRENRMIRRLLEATYASRGTAGIHKRVGDCFRQCRIAYVMRT